MFMDTATTVINAIIEMKYGILVLAGFMTLMYYDERLTNWLNGRTPEVIAAEQAAAKRIRDLRTAAAEACALAASTPTDANLKRAQTATMLMLCEVAAQRPTNANITAVYGSLAAAAE